MKLVTTTSLLVGDAALCVDTEPLLPDAGNDDLKPMVSFVETGDFTPVVRLWIV